MLHGVEIEIEQFSGMHKGLIKTEPLDVIWACRDGKRSKLGYVARAPDATVLLIRYLPPDEREPIRAEVERLRHESGGYPITKRIGSIPDPRLIKAAVKGDIQRKSATTSTIVMPDGTPAQSEDDDDYDD